MSSNRAVLLSRSRHDESARAIGNQGIGVWIERHSILAPDRVALVYGDALRTYAELARRVRHLAHGLRALGVGRGDRVAWLGANHPAFLEGLFASATLGAVLTPINHRLDRQTIEAILADVGPQVVLLDESLTGLPLPPGKATIVFGTSDDATSPYELLIAGAADGPIDELHGSGELALMPFTSGTTGTPKGIMLSHGNLTWNVMNALTAIGFRRDDVTIAVAPFFRTGGLGVNVLPVLFVGGTVVVPRRPDPGEVLQLVERHRVTVGFGGPDLLESFARSPRWDTADLTSVRAFITGGALVSERLLRAYRARGINVLQGYGLSEAAPLVSVLDSSSALRKDGSAGRPVPFVDVRVVRRDETDAAPEEVGELLVRGPNVMEGYWKRPDATRRAIDEHGWLRTGDAVRRDDEGFLFIVGRVQDAYEAAGQLVHPSVAERLFLQHPAVREVSVIGGNGVATAYVVAGEGAAAEIAPALFSLGDTHLPAHARPAAIEFVCALPKNPAGKILRHLVGQGGAANCRVAPADSVWRSP